jgi:predicted exporter
MRYLNWQTNWQNKASIAWIAITLVVAVCLGVMHLKGSIHIQSDIFKLLPSVSDNAQVLDSQKTLSERLNRQVFVMLQADSQTALDTATEHLTDSANNSPAWQTVTPYADSDTLGQTLYQHRAGLLDDTTRHYLQTGNYDALLEKSTLQLFSPATPVNEQLLKDDPLLLFIGAMVAQSGAMGDISLQKGWATLEPNDERPHYLRLMVLNTANSPYDVENQTLAIDWLAKQKDALASDNITLAWTGTLAFANFGTQSAKQEISTIGLGSSIGVVLLVLFGFRSLRPLFTEFIAVTVGTLFAFVITHLVFGEIHLMTLVFGASLIGVCVDFSFYFMAMQSSRPHDNGFKILTPLLPSLFLGLMTTIVAYVFLLITPFIVFRQIAVFSMVGLFAAWITSILLLPRLPALNAKPALHALSFLGRLRAMIMPFATRRYALIGMALVVSAIGLSQIRFNDDIRTLQSTSPALLADEKLIRQTFHQQHQSQYFILTADNQAQLEHSESELLDKLSALQSQGAVTGVQAPNIQAPNIQALGNWANSVRQSQNIALLQAIPQDVLQRYADSTGLDIDDILAWQANLNNPTLSPTLSLSDLAQHPLAPLALSDTSRIVLVQGATDRTALLELQNEHTFFIEPTHALSEQFGLHRVHAQWLLLSALVCLAIGLGLLYGIKSVLPLMLPVSLALSTTFALQALMGVELNLFSIMACFLILGIGVDYAIFYRHGHGQDGLVAVALFLCMLSTLLGFGLLSLSSTYAIFCFGVTVLGGVVLSFIFATCLTQSDAHYGKRESTK